MLLVNPPVAKPCEAPASIAHLAGALFAHGVPHAVVDLNVESAHALCAAAAGMKPPRGDRFAARALKHVKANLDFLRSREGYMSPARYARAVGEIDRAVGHAGALGGFRVSLANLAHDALSPLRSADLSRAAERPEENPFFPFFSGRLRDAASGRDVIGVSITYLSQALTAFAVMGWLRREFPKKTVVAGGGLVTSWMGRADLNTIFKRLKITFVAGPGEESLLDIAGVDPRIRRRHAPPAFGWFPLDDYLAPGFVMPYRVSAGCWWGRCRFCPERAEGNAYRAVPADEALRQVVGLVGAHAPALVHFTDNALAPAFVNALAAGPIGAPWYGFARVTEELADPLFCRGLKASGCRLLKLGVESGSDRVLDRMQKGFDTALSSAALRALRDAGIPVYAYVLFGTPDEAEADARETLDFCARHADAIAFMNVAVFNLPAGSPDAGALDTAPFYEGDLSLYTDFVHPSGWGRKEARAFVNREFRRHRAIAPIISRVPAAFTSNHAAFFVDSPRC